MSPRETATDDCDADRSEPGRLAMTRSHRAMAGSRSSGQTSGGHAGRLGTSSGSVFHEAVTGAAYGARWGGKARTDVFPGEEARGRMSVGGGRVRCPPASI